MKKLLIISLLAVLVGAVCRPAAASGQAVPGAAAAGTREMSFLTRIRLADPDYQVILMACLKGNELNLLLNRNLSTDQIPILLKGLAGQLSRALPGQDLAVVAFRPVLPLREYGVARISSETGQITYTDSTGSR